LIELEHFGFTPKKLAMAQPNDGNSVPETLSEGKNEENVIG